MESEGLDKRMAREATIGLVVLVALVGLLFLTIWLKAQAAWSVDDESLLSSRVNVFEVDRGNVLTPLKKPPLVPLPDVESNNIVDLGEMRPISSDKMAAMMGSVPENVRVAVADPSTTLPGFPSNAASPSLPSPQLPDRDLPTPNLPPTNLPRTDLPAAPGLLPQFGSLPAAPGRGSEASLPTITPDASGPTGLPPVPGELEKIPNRELPTPESSATDPNKPADANSATFLAEDSSEPKRETDSTPIGLTPIVSTPVADTSGPQVGATVPASALTTPVAQLPLLAGPIGDSSVPESSVAENSKQDPASSLEPNRVPAADSISDPILDALHRAAAEAQSSVTTITVHEANDETKNNDAAKIEADSPSYTSQELKAAMRRLSLPAGVSMGELSQRLYGDTRYALALQQLNHRRADDRGRFLPGTQIVYLPGPMLSFVYPDLVKPTSLPDEAGTIATVQYQQPLPPEANPTTPLPDSESVGSTESSRRAAQPEASSDSSRTVQENPASVVPAPTVSPEWITTEGGESLFQLAVDHFDQASYYLNLYEWNRVAMEGRYRPTDPLPKGMRIRLAPPTP